MLTDEPPFVASVPPRVLSDLSPAKLDEREASLGLINAADDAGGRSGSALEQVPA